MAAGLRRSPSYYEGLQPENYAGVVKKRQIIFRRDQEVWSYAEELLREQPDADSNIVAAAVVLSIAQTDRHRNDV